jgi:dihydroorotate dehydrogenase
MGLVWEKLVRPAMFGIDAERAHEIAMKALKLGLTRGKRSFPEFGTIERFGLTFDNPLGIAAGFDKNGVAVNQLAELGFGFVEVGTVTLQPQEGNPKPRLFRLPDDQALINRLGFNNEGAETVASRLEKLKRKCIVGVNIGKNKDVPNEEAVENYLACFEIVHPVADYIAVNVSSPNTPNLRELQQTDSLETLLSALQEKNKELGSKPLVVKIAPDLSEPEIHAIVDICLSQKISGIIATNTTISREGLQTNHPEQFGSGGLSGRPLISRSNEVINSIYRYSKRKLPIIGVGGILTAEDAFEKIVAGASLLQGYTGFIYGGPTFPPDINKGLATLLISRGFSRLDEAVGSSIKVT